MTRPLVLAAAALIAALSLSPVDARAGCTTGTLEVFPRFGAVLPTNGRIVLHGTGVYADPVASIAARSPRFVSAHDDVPLRVDDVLVGPSARAAGVEVVLVPERELVDGETYTVELSKARPGELLAATPTFYWHPAERTMTWTVAGRVGPRDVAWRTVPRRVRDVDERFCPRALYTLIEARLSHPELVLGVLIESRGPDPGAPIQRFLVPVEDGELALGHLGCERNVDLAPDRRTRVRLTAVDLGGGRHPAGTVVITAPGR